MGSLIELQNAFGRTFLQKVGAICKIGKVVGATQGTDLIDVVFIDGGFAQNAIVLRPYAASNAGWISGIAPSVDLDSISRKTYPEAMQGASIRGPSTVSGSPALSAYPNTFDDLFAAAGAKYGIDPTLLKALAATESSMVSTKTQLGGRVVGLMQIYTTKHPEFDPAQLLSDPEYNINAGAAILAANFKQSQNMLTALANYKGFDSYVPGARSAELVGRVIGLLPAGTTDLSALGVTDVAQFVQEQEPVPHRDVYAACIACEDVRGYNAGWVVLGFLLGQPSEMNFTTQSGSNGNGVASASDIAAGLSDATSGLVDVAAALPAAGDNGTSDLFLIRHTSDMQITIDRNAVLNIGHPSGARISVGDRMAFSQPGKSADIRDNGVDLTALDLNRWYKIRNNTNQTPVVVIDDGAGSTITVDSSTGLITIEGSEGATVNGPFVILGSDILKLIASPGSGLASLVEGAINDAVTSKVKDILSNMLPDALSSMLPFSTPAAGIGVDAPLPVARVGDTVACPAGTGVITKGSMKVFAG